ncbi:hypothetical protein HHI36_014408, partial [Cryptolaemus montrouzieri]
DAWAVQGKIRNFYIRCHVVHIWKSDFQCIAAYYGFEIRALKNKVICRTMSKRQRGLTESELQKPDDDLTNKDSDD